MFPLCRLHAVSLFPQRVPPFVGFRTGSLNFLVKYKAASFAQVLEDVFAGRVLVNLRARISYRLTSADGTVKVEHTALNELAVTRGCDPHLCKVDIYMNRQKLSRIEGDGILICTPTGSTAYGLAAGGSVLHPSVACMQLVPIAPHTICTRSIVVPCTAEVVFRLAENSRLASAVVASDGIKSFTMGSSDVLVMWTSLHPLPILYSVQKPEEVESSDWLKSFFWCQKLVAPGTPDAAEAQKPPGGQEEVTCKPCSLSS
jgi:NAD kinase